MLTSAKLREFWYLNVYFLKLNMCVFFRGRYKVCSIILTCFIQGRGKFYPAPSPPTLKQTLKSSPKLGLISDLCDYNDGYIVVKRRTTAEEDNDDKTRNKKLVFKYNNTLFRLCISKINDIFVDNAEDLDIAMPMYNLLEYCDNYSITSEIFRNYYGSEINDSAIENNDDGNKINNNNTMTSKFFESKTKQ